LIADSVIALIMHAQSSAASIRLTSRPCRHPRDSTTDDQAQEKQKSEEDVHDPVESRLRFIHGLLKDQFANVEAVYEGRMANYEIVTDAGLEPSVLDDDGKLQCSVKVEFEDIAGNDAKISIECRDQKMAANVQRTIRNAVEAAAPVKI
jgi:hypothetical protein